MEYHFRSICGSPIWNHQTVYLAYPDFTTCFHYTILKWVPCFVLWIVAPFWTYALTSNVQNKLRPSLLSILKALITVFLIIIEVVYLILAYMQSKFIVFYMTPLIFIVTYLLVLFFNHFERIRGLQSSSLLFVFWSFLVFTSSITLRSKILMHYYDNNKSSPDLVDIYMFYVFYILICVNLILSTFSEKFSKKTQKPHKKKQSPENAAPLLNKLTFWWMDRLIKTGFKRSITPNDIWDIDSSESSKYVSDKLEYEWSKKADIYIQSLSKMSTNKKVSAIYKTNLNTNHDEELILNRVSSELELSIKDGKKPSLALCLIKVFGGKFFAGAFLKLVQDLLSFAGPVILHLIINFIEDKHQIMMVGIFLTALLFLTSSTQSLMQQQYFFSYVSSGRSH